MSINPRCRKNFWNIGRCWGGWGAGERREAGGLGRGSEGEKLCEQCRQSYWDSRLPTHHSSNNPIKLQTRVSSFPHEYSYTFLSIEQEGPKININCSHLTLPLNLKRHDSSHLCFSGWSYWAKFGGAAAIWLWGVIAQQARGVSSPLHSGGHMDDCKSSWATSAPQSSSHDPTWLRHVGHGGCQSQQAIEEKIYIFWLKSHFWEVLVSGTSSTSNIMCRLREWRCTGKQKSMHNLSLHLTLQDQDYNFGWREADEGDQDWPRH